MALNRHGWPSSGRLWSGVHGAETIIADLVLTASLFQTAGAAVEKERKAREVRK